MAFDEKGVERLLVECHRRCCVCHRFCGVKIEIDHIRPRGDDGTDEIDNAIALCFECHAEVHLYNPKHPKGRRFRESELKAHRDQWLRICRDNPGALLDAPRSSDPGTMERLLHELEFDQHIANLQQLDEMGCPFELVQIQKAIADGTILILEENLRALLERAYLAMRRANTFIAALGGHGHPRERGSTFTDAQKAVRAAFDPITRAMTDIGEALGQRE